MLSPIQAQVAFGVHATSSAPNAYLAAKGARDITLGICYFAFGYQRNLRALRTLVMAHVVTGAVDTAIVYLYGIKEKVWGHAIGTLGLVVLVAGGFID